MSDDSPVAAVAVELDICLVLKVGVCAAVYCSSGPAAEVEFCEGTPLRGGPPGDSCSRCTFPVVEPLSLGSSPRARDFRGSVHGPLGPMTYPCVYHL
jgi:hypothetical protein